MDANLSARLATAAIGIPLLVLWVGWSPPWLFSTVLFVLTVTALWEYFDMAFPRRWLDQGLGVAFGVCWSGAMFLSGRFDPVIWIDVVLLVGCSAYLFGTASLAERFNRFLIALLGAVYIGYFFPHWVLLFRYSNGRAWVFWVLSVIMVGDVFAYFIGRRFGRRQLAPELSPGKTVAGAWGYLLGGMIAGVIGWLFLLDTISWLETLALALALSVLGQVGDLFESWIKRVFAVKDSGRWLPGHGGLLDRLDSLIFPAVFTTTYLKVFHP